MKKQVAIITGASRGIGKAVALDLAKQGYTVALLARSATKLKAVAKEIQQYGGECDTYSLDIANAKQVAEAVKKVVAKYKRIDVLFNNAGIANLGSITLAPKQIDAIIDTNLKGAIYIASQVVPVMQQQKSGYIINMSSTAGLEGFSDIGVYGASKFGLCGYSESLFNELLPDGIKVTAICPGYVNTDMPEWVSADKKELMIPTDEIVRSVRYLLQADRRAAIKELIIYCTDCLCGKLD